MPYLLLGPDEAHKGTAPLAIVRSSDPALHGRLISVSDDHRDSPSPTRFERTPRLDAGKYTRILRRAGMTPREAARAIGELEAGVRAGKSSSEMPSELRVVFTAALDDMAGPEFGDEVTLPPLSSFEPVPNPNPEERDAICFLGRPGCGKTYLMAAFVRRYHALFPERAVYILSKNDTSTDPAWLALPEKARPKAIDPASLLASEVDMARDLARCCVIVDDALDAFDGKMNKAVERFCADALDIGRRACITVLISMHLLTAGHRSRTLLNSSHSAVIFPSLTPTHSLRYFLTKLGLDAKELIPKLRRMGRWVQISLTAPVWCLAETSCCLLD